ncbi:MAG: hypothetical protein JRH20_27110 [Deltaproteobacteria bacterium]|nr:hypothetical protein [Deltaproteobacteria bacterium]
MRKRVKSVSRGLGGGLGLALLLAAAPQAAARPLVDCNKKEFQLMNSARSLFLWSKGAEARIRKAKKLGVFGGDPLKSTGSPHAVSSAYCPKMISNRGSAHCKEPKNAEYRASLVSILAVCRDAAKAPKTSAKSGGVDCSDKRFKKPGADVPLLLRWTTSALSGLDRLERREAFRIKVKCDQAHQYAGTAYCKAPQNPKTLAALAHVKKTCAAALGKSAAQKKQEAVDQKASIDAAKANRKMVRFPRSTYRGAGRSALSAAMKRALVAPKLAKSTRDVLRVQPMGSWKKGRYRGTRIPFQQILGTVLWRDKDKDGVCRFVSYNFVKERKGGRWSKLRVKSFCMGCPEGWTRCR